MTTVIACVVTAIWATSHVVGMVSAHYSIPVGIHALMLIVVSALFTEKFVKRDDQDPEK